MRILSRFQFIKIFIEFVLVETKRFPGSHPNVILTQQTCGQRSSMLVGSKHWELAFYFSIRNCYMFLISKCREKSDPGLCTTSILARRMPLHIGEFRLNNVFGRKICWNSLMCSGILFASTEIVQRPRSDFSLHLDLKNIWQIVIRQKNC